MFTAFDMAFAVLFTISIFVLIWSAFVVREAIAKNKAN